MVGRVDDPFLTWIKFADLRRSLGARHAAQRQAPCGFDRWSDRPHGAGHSLSGAFGGSETFEHDLALGLATLQ